MKKISRWPRRILSIIYVVGVLVLISLIAKDFVFINSPMFSIDKGEKIIFGVSVVEEHPSTLLSELQEKGNDIDWTTSFLLQSQSPSTQIYLDYISVFPDSSMKPSSKFCIKSIYLSQNDKVPLKVFFEINKTNSLGQLTTKDEKHLNQYVYTFNDDLCLERGSKYFLPHVLLGMVSSRAYVKTLGPDIIGYKAFEFFPFDEQNILIDIFSRQSSNTNNGSFFRPSLEITISQPGWIGEFYTDEKGLTNLHLSRPTFYKAILLTFAAIMAILIFFLNEIVEITDGFFEVAFGLLLGLWGMHEILIPDYIASSIPIDAIIYTLYALVIGEIVAVFVDETIINWGKRKVEIESIEKGGVKKESVTIINKSIFPIDMTSWILLDEVGHKFKFPSFILKGKSKVRVWTSNQDPEIMKQKKDLQHFTWGRKQSVWNDKKDTAYLEDANGNVVHHNTYIKGHDKI
ncbi:MAG: lamin tail domain-containing protein [Anaerolineales bacterium]